MVDGRVNARARLVEDLHKRNQAWLRSLRLAGAAAGDTRDRGPMRALERRSNRTAEDMSDDDDLLA